MIGQRSARCCLAFLVLSTAAPISAADLVAELDIRTVANSNIFVDKSKEWDLVLKPSVELGLDFGKAWSLGYAGELNAYTRHSDLLSHWHELYLFFNPAWGEQGENELTAEVSVETLRNREGFAALNLFQPSLLVKLIAETRPWFRWQLSARGAWKWFYDDRSSDSLDAWMHAQVAFTLPSRTTLSPRIAYGLRTYVHPGSGSDRDERDQQIELGLHMSQALWSTAGLQIDYAYLYAIGDNGILSRKLTQAQFSYLGEEFLFSGHRASVGFKQLIAKGATVWLSARLEERDWADWPAIDGEGRVTGENRGDWRLMPRATVSYAWRPAEKGASAYAPYAPRVNIHLEYRFVRQWSNSDWYETTSHVIGLSLWGSW